MPKKKDLLCQEDDRSEGGKISRYSGSGLPEDIWCHIHSLMPLRDAAHSACVSRTFLRSWRCHPNLNFTKETLCVKRNACGKGGVARCFTMRVDQILKNHSGIGVKTLILDIPDSCKIDICRLNHWLQIAIAPGIEEVTIFLHSNYKTKYSFPCSLLFGGCGNSIRHLRLTNCAFRPPVGFDCLRSLTKVHLYEVCITGDELGNLFSNSFALEHLELISCSDLISLKIPFWLERLSFLRVFECNMLQVIESKAPNLHTFKFFGNPGHLTLGESSQVKSLDFRLSNNFNSITYAITKLPSTVPTLETLKLTSFSERVNTPMAADKFLNLKCLQIYLAGYEAFSPSYDYLSLVSFLDASPALETFILSVNQDVMKHDSVFGNASPMRQILGHKHDRLRKVQINGFCSAKSMVELTCHILENATSLESLTVDTIFAGFIGDDVRRCFLQKKSKCRSIPRDMILEAHNALRAVSSFIVGRVPPAIKLNVWEPCSRCHAIDVKLP
ncbi:hypothetical protein SEVIR_7G274700v4 [Setaria viridis]|uniref:Uncharacterized protein n=3 Tax=Setaria TaxID=4554 RepID=K3Y6T3_SETIT|nr:uncharacterized protein LOC101773439 isoform X2 [Setaria italica]XP_012702684.1 uncharacterized protein LOC101773439 isoform X2 [Setaria italica]XP_012702685.1 uncharacterized protein LOC101773439 isoform X2 [Setaria italica]XP_012702686.1 uncharacterized protein LOC101773439 isoform X2 [Setaria italica]XP_022684440.1 uncharacterized protein LOC101773439 isoform X2 [Setaria italica]XP_022684441.1 uncharacterized protein LOC101773439 isoform X2 [Setaria italica]XP_022684442.1 uncharacterize